MPWEGMCEFGGEAEYSRLIIKNGCRSVNESKIAAELTLCLWGFNLSTWYIGSILPAISASLSCISYCTTVLPLCHVK